MRMGIHIILGWNIELKGNRMAEIIGLSRVRIGWLSCLSMAPRELILNGVEVSFITEVTIRMILC